QHRVEVLHVDRTATPDVAVLDLAAERVDLPVLRRRRYDVQVAVEEQPVGPATGARAAPVSHDGGAAGGGLVQAWLDADLVEQRGDVLGGLALTGPAGAVGLAVVARVDPDQVAAQLDDLSGRVVARTGLGFHDPI